MEQLQGMVTVTEPRIEIDLPGPAPSRAAVAPDLQSVTACLGERRRP